jgi:tRNA-2-methylthio-N6-dimethylallyladenosine synthase
MNRNYTVDDYKNLISQIRSAIPDMALSTDIIVGFPGESEDQFLNTYRAIEEIRFTAVHVAAYSPRTGTLASRIYKDDVPASDKLRRLHAIEDLQRNILAEENNGLVNTDVEVLVEGQKDGKWYGRAYSDKLVFFPGSGDLMGQTIHVRLTSASPWALQGIISPEHVISRTPTRT